MNTNRWQNFLQNVRQYGDVYVTILLCVFVAILGVFGVADIKIVVSAILGALSVELYALLNNRRTNQELKKSMEMVGLESQQTGRELKSSLEELLKRSTQTDLSEMLRNYSREKEKLRDHLNRANEVWIVSRTGLMLWRDFNDEFENIACERKGLRLMFIDPRESVLLNMIARSAVWSKPEDSSLLKANMEQFVGNLALLCENSKTFQKFEVRLINHLPPWTLFLINPRDGSGTIFVEMATYRSDSNKRPLFVVHENRDGELYKLFRKEFEEMWKNARSAWELDAEQSKILIK
jgi:hypothetical protein